jgi:hypothetical protein
MDDLVERTTADPGAAFTPEVLERLAALRRDDRGAFEALRAQLKKAGCRVTALDKTMAGGICRVRMPLTKGRKASILRREVASPHLLEKCPPSRARPCARDLGVTSTRKRLMRHNRLNPPFYHPKK